MNIKQWEDETLRSYITRFNKEALSINEGNEKILMVAFTNWLQKGKFLFSLYKNDPKTMSIQLLKVERSGFTKHHRDMALKTWLVLLS